MDIVKVLENEKNGAEYVENVGWLEKKVKDDVVVLENMTVKQLVKSSDVKQSDKVICVEGDFSLITSTSASEYVVKPLDTLEKISKKFNVEYSRLVQINNLSTTKLFIGQVLKL